MNRLPIGPRLTLMVAVGGLLILALVTGYFYFAARDVLVDELEAKALHLSTATASRIETVERAVEKVALELAVALGEVEHRPETLYALLRSTVRAHEEIYGSAIAFRPGALSPGAGAMAPYVYRGPDGLAELDLGQGDYRYDTWDWFLIPLALGRPAWSEPFFDEDGGDILMITYSVPFYAPGSEEPAGVVTADVSLRWLRDYLATLPLEESGFAFLLSRTGAMVSHPDDDYVMNQSLFSLAAAREDPALRTLGKRMVAGESGFVEYRTLDGDDGWLVFTPVTTTGMSLGVFFAHERIMATVWGLSRAVLLIGGLGAALLVLVVALAVRRIAVPVRKLTAAAQTMSTGRLDVALPAYDGTDEIARLTAAFDRMRLDLQAHIAEALEKKRIEGQLQVARQIQRGLLPAELPETPGLDVAGESISCLEVAGDYYDVIPLAGGRTALAVADVSGKGAGAALIMANVQAALRALIRSDRPLAGVVRGVNDVMEHNTPCGDFVTAFVAVHDPAARTLTYVNAGHDPPLVLRGDGRVEMLDRGGPVLGVLADCPFDQAIVPFEEGDVLFTYTDGLSETMNEDDEEFGPDRVRDFLVAHSDLPPGRFLEELRRAAVRFGGREVFHDDFTLLFARRVPDPGGPQAQEAA